MIKIRRKKRIISILSILFILFVIFGLSRILFAVKPHISEDEAIYNATGEAMSRFRDTVTPYKLEEVTCRIQERNDGNLFRWLFGRSCYEVNFVYSSPAHPMAFGILVDYFSGEIIYE